MTEPNIPMLRKAVEWVEDQSKLPEIDREWYQDDFVSYPHVRAVRLVYSERSHPRDLVDHAAAVVEPYCGTAYCVAGYVGQLMDPRYAETDVVDGLHVAEFAQDVLGIDTDVADDLFEAGNSAENIRRIAEAAAGEPL